MRFPDIHYMRWARAFRDDDAGVALILSGMPPPPPHILEDLDPATLVGGDGSDHPPVAARLAEAWGVPPEGVLIQPGSHWNLLLAVAARLDAQPGPVVVEQPAYEPLRRIPEALDAEILRLPRDRSRGYALDLQALESLAEARPSLLLLTHPHNPSGHVLGDDEMRAVADWSRRTGCAVLSDEVYLEFLERPDESSLRNWVEGAVSIRSFTKVMGLGRLRCSALVGPAPWIARCARITDYGAVMLPGPAQEVAKLAWNHREELWARARLASQAGRRVVEAWAAGVTDLLEVPVPRTGIICFARLDPDVARAAVSAARASGVEGTYGFGLDDDPGAYHLWIEALRRDEGVLVTPGGFFEDPLGFRIGFGVNPADLRRGLNALERHLRAATRTVAA